VTLPITTLSVNEFPDPPVQTTVVALDVCSCSLAFDDIKIFGRIGSAQRASDRAELGDMGLTKGIDGLHAPKFCLISTAMDSPAFLVVKSHLEALLPKGAFTTDGLGPVFFFWLVAVEVDQS
jgi:hypothetical protein